MQGIDDVQLPGLADLGQDRLRALTGADQVDLLRLRYRTGKRAILHIATRTGAAVNEGTLWFFAGDKARRIARRNKGATRYDAAGQILFEAFPQDHRMPQIREFLSRYRTILPVMTGHRASAAPELLRYRPGLSCTFRCALDGRGPAYVKLVNDDEPARLLAANRAMRTALAGGPLGVAPALGIDRELGAIAYGSASGDPLDRWLQQTGDLAPLIRAISVLRGFGEAQITPERRMGPEMLLARARESADFVTLTAPCCTPATAAILARLERAPPAIRLRPIHGDVKLEHLFLDDDGVTLIDTESVSLGLPDYDLAQLYGRLWQAEQEGHLPTPLVRDATAYLRSQAGPAFDWCLGVATLRLAKYYAQRPSPGMADSIRAILSRLR